MIDPPALWEGVLARLDEDVPAFAVEAWVRPLVPAAKDDGIRLYCSSEFQRSRASRYLSQIQQCAEREAGRAVSVSLEVEPARTRRPAARRGEIPLGEGASDAPRPGEGAEGEAGVRLRPKGGDGPPGHDADRRPAPRLRSVRPAHPASPRVAAQGGPAWAQPPLPYSFDTFVVGSCNALAREASLALARGEQGGVTPLYLASEPGLGKTHLAGSIVREARRAGASRVVYTSAEAFTSQLAASIQNRSTSAFKRRFRNECDLLVLEDVQFLVGKKATQLELFHTLQHLRAAGRRVVLTGERIPLEIAGFDARSASLMTSGLVAEIHSPSRDVRGEILRAKAAAGGVRLPEPCLERLVEGVQGSVRDLEGVLTQLVSSAVLLKRPIDLELTEAALRKLAPASPGRVLEPREVIPVVARFFGTTPAALATRSRRADVCLPRKVAMYLCHRYTDASLAAIGRLFGRNHTSVRNAVTSVERELLARAPLRYKLEELTARLEAQRRT